MTPEESCHSFVDDMWQKSVQKLWNYLYKIAENHKNS